MRQYLIHYKASNLKYGTGNTRLRNERELHRSFTCEAEDERQAWYLFTQYIDELRRSEGHFTVTTSDVKDMEDIKIAVGTFSTVEVKTFDDIIEKAAYRQLLELANDPVSAHTKPVVMPDYHAGAGNVIGLTMDLKKTNMVVPDLIGPDIGCGVRLTYFKTEEPIDLRAFDEHVNEVIHTDKNTMIDPKLSTLKTLRKLHSYEPIIEKHAMETFGTLGGGNHFIELYKVDESQNLYGLAVHSGSRSVGSFVHKWYNTRATKYDNDKYNELKANLIYQMKKNNEHDKIEQTLKTVTPRTFGLVSSQYRFLTGELKKQYMEDLVLLNTYTERHRKEITSLALWGLGKIKIINVIDKPHNFIGTDGILRKGAQAASNLDDVLIPINMAEGMIVGKVLYHNTRTRNWNYSLPHGAGRALSRSAAKDTLKVKDFKEQMKGIYSTSINADMLDEAPNAYKKLNAILPVIKRSLSEYTILKPIYNFKGV